MTDELQPMDLIANVVFKKTMRDIRCEQVLEYMQSYRQDLKEWAVLAGVSGDHADRPIWIPPKASYRQGVQAFSGVVKGRMTEKDFRRSLNRCFVAVGLIQQYDITGERVGYVNYVRKKLGSSRIEAGLTDEDCIAG